MSAPKKTKKNQSQSKPKTVSPVPDSPSQSRLRKSLVIVGILLIMVVAAFFVGKIFFPPEKPLCAANFNLLVITLDTVRADRLGVYGHKTAQTPNLDRLARQGVWFENCFTPVPLTLAAHSTIFTGKYPLGHSVRGNGTYTLPEKEITLAEKMKEKGYTTFGVISSFVLLAKFGLQQGFDFFDDSLNSHKMYNNYTSEITADQVYNKFLQWFVKNDQKQFFAWIHLYDAHEPYNPPRKFLEKLGTSQSQRYDGEIAFADEAIGKIMEALQKKNVLDNTLIVIMGDHGEGFGEHQEYGHGIFCYNETLKVPLILYNPSITPQKGLSIKESVNLVDIYPTLLELFGFQPQASVQGKSLVPLLMGKPQKPRNFYFESLHGRDEMNWAPPMGIMDGSYKYINLPDPELYDLEKDPLEKNNLFWKKNLLAKDLDKKLAQQIALLSKGADASDAQRELTAEDKAHLTTLGYISSFSNKTRQELDPKKGIVLDNQIKHIYALLEQQQLSQAEAELTGLIAENPGSHLAVFYDLKQQLYTQQKRPDKLIEALQEAIQEHPKIERFYILLAFEWYNQGKLAETRQICDRLLRLNPNFTRAHILLGEIAERQQDMSGAMAFYKKALEIEPQNISLKLKYADLLILEKSFLAALNLYDDLLQRQEVANNPDFLYRVALLHLQQGIALKAEQVLARILQLDPQGKYYYTYAMALYKNDKLKQALDNMEIALAKYSADLNPQQLQTASQAVEVWRKNI